MAGSPLFVIDRIEHLQLSLAEGARRIVVTAVTRETRAKRCCAAFAPSRGARRNNSRRALRLLCCRTASAPPPAGHSPATCRRHAGDQKTERRRGELVFPIAARRLRQRGWRRPRRGRLQQWSWRPQWDWRRHLLLTGKPPAPVRLSLLSPPFAGRGAVERNACRPCSARVRSNQLARWRR